MKVTLPLHTDKQLAGSLPFRGQQRLEMVRHYEIPDTFPEESFERLTRLAATIFATPIALISLLDHGRQWFKSNYGLDVGETPLDVSFCRHAIEEDGVMVITDATKDQRFADNHLVTGDPHIRFYAGAPLHLLDGPKIGTLCVIDRIPRKAPRKTRLGASGPLRWHSWLDFASFSTGMDLPLQARPPGGYIQIARVPQPWIAGTGSPANNRIKSLGTTSRRGSHAIRRRSEP